jgi:aldose 1-epimerase
LPTGRLVPLAQGPADLRQPTSLADLAIDDVFCGMSESAPMAVFYDDTGRRLLIAASDAFTHCVVFTPTARPFFCLENQTCSTDAHNLHSLGLYGAAHLSILDPGESASSWVRYTVHEA